MSNKKDTKSKTGTSKSKTVASKSKTGTSKSKTGAAAQAANRKILSKVIIGVLVLVLVAGAAVGAWLIWGNNAAPPTPTLRYDTVRVDEIRESSNQNTNSVPNESDVYDDSDEPYHLADSYYDDDTYYHIFYLGYIKSVPIAYGTAIRYENTPINITFTKTSEFSSTVTHSLTQSAENSITSHREVNFSVSGTLGYKSPASHGSITASVGGLFSWEYTNTRSTTNTIERAESVTTGESFSISATIGEHNESKGVYRYSLFGTTDVYYILELNKSDTTYKDATTIHCARGDMAWGIDFSPNGDYGKTSNSKNLEIPDNIDFTKLPVPTEKLEEELPDDSEPDYYTFKFEPGWVNASTPDAKIAIEQGDAEISDSVDKITKFKFEVILTPSSDSRYVDLEINYTVYEGDASPFEPSQLKMTYTRRIDLGEDHRLKQINEKHKYQLITGSEPENNDCTDQYLTIVYNGTAAKTDVIKKLVVRLDGPDDDNFSNGIAFEVRLAFDYLEAVASV